MTAEEWRAVADAPGYFVSSRGRVLSTKGAEPLFLKPRVSGSGLYLDVWFSLGSRGNGISRFVHQLVLEAFVGPAPDGAEVCHRNHHGFDNRVENLTYGTHTENMRAMVDAGRHYLGQREACIRGHLFTGDNTYQRPGGGTRICRTCQSEHQRAYKARKAAARREVAA